MIEDRVRCYGIGTTGGHWISKMEGTISGLNPNGTLRVTLDRNYGIVMAHPKQCRRIFKRYKRRVWVAMTGPAPHNVFASLEGAETAVRCSSPLREIVEFVEVFRKKVEIPVPPPPRFLYKDSSNRG